MESGQPDSGDIIESSDENREGEKMMESVLPNSEDEEGSVEKDQEEDKWPKFTNNRGYWLPEQQPRFVGPPRPDKIHLQSSLTFFEDGSHIVKEFSSDETSTAETTSDSTGKTEQYPGSLRFFKPGTEIQVHPHYQFTVIKEGDRKYSPQIEGDDERLQILVNEGQLVQIEDNDLGKVLTDSTGSIQWALQTEYLQKPKMVDLLKVEPDQTVLQNKGIVLTKKEVRDG